MRDHGIVVALGGNALAPSSETGTIAQQFRHTRESLGAVVELAGEGWKIAIVHGNGPQVGNDLVRNEVARRMVPPLPLGVLVAGTEGWIGYMIQQSLQNALRSAEVDRQVVTLVTQVVVDPDDPQLRAPSKPIGRVMDEETANDCVETFGWNVAPEKDGWRRVVPSPRPIGIVEGRMIRTLFDQGHLVIAAGGGGTPVFIDRSECIEGIDAVVDKDRAAAVLGVELAAEILLVLTDVEAIYADFGTPEQRPIRRLDVDQAEALLAAGALGAGNMAPKVEAAIHFLRHGGKRALIARLDQGREAVTGGSGTEIRTE
ncbi:MAG: carbamate kinase [Gemmatimonas sp.]|nr:carbamate kinase [Gemmatimonas sp.]